MVNSALTQIESDTFRAQFAYIATPSALYRALRKSKEVGAIRTSLASGEINESTIRGFVNTLLQQLRDGESFRFDVALAGLAVAIEERDTSFAEEYIHSLAQLDAVALAMSVRVARVCLKNRRTVANTVVGEKNFPLAPRFQVVPYENLSQLFPKDSIGFGEGRKVIAC